MKILIDSNMYNKDTAISMVKDLYKNNTDICCGYEEQEVPYKATEYEQGYCDALGKTLPKTKLECICNGACPYSQSCTCRGDRTKCNFYKN